MSSRDPWVLGHLVKTSPLRGKVDRSISESPVINPKSISQFMIPLLLDSKAVPLFISSKVHLLAGGMSDLGVNLALWMY